MHRTLRSTLAELAPGLGQSRVESWQLFEIGCCKCVGSEIRWEIMEILRALQVFLLGQGTPKVSAISWQPITDQALRTFHL